jgi:L,D-transpeptidase YcbB
MTRNLLDFIPAYWRGIFVRLQMLPFLVAAISSCHHFSGNTFSGDVPSSADVQKIALIDSSSAHFDSLRNGMLVHQFYLKHHFVPVWWEHKKPSARADSMLNIIRSIREYGLLPQHYHSLELQKLLYDSVFDDNIVRKTDMLFTDAFLAIFKDLKYGRMAFNESHADSIRTAADSVALVNLTRSIRTNDIRTILEEQEPRYLQYVMLKAALRRMLRSDSLDGHAFWRGDLMDTSKAGSQILSLEINMDRWRRETSASGRHILVNIPGCYLELTENDSVSFQSRVIVGTDKNQTPVLDGLIRSFIIYPYWNVPRSIAVNEILPQVKRDSLYIRNHHYEVINTAGEVVIPDSVNWNVLHRNNFPYTIRQKEGLHNALGLIKFWFNNPYAVFLHDTNARLLFERKKRALSHGCVRVERAMELGRYLVKGNDVVSPEDLDQYLEFEKQLTIRVTEPIPVYLRYLTCAWRNGTVEFYDDIYGEDKAAFDRIYSNEVFTKGDMLLAQNGGK